MGCGGSKEKERGYKRVWTIGCGASEGKVSIWRPDIAAPYVFFGDSVVCGGSAPRDRHVMVRDDEIDTAPPVGFRRVVDQQRGGAVYIWEPVPPSPDYVALGDVATLSASTPDPARDFPHLRCVARRLTQATPLCAYDTCKIWADSGTGGPDFAFFSAPTDSLFVTMGPGRPGGGGRRHSAPVGPFSRVVLVQKYKFSREQLTWDEHAARAKFWGGHLASVESQADNDRFVRMWHEAGVDNWGLWVGGQRKPGKQEARNGGPACWEWADGTPWSFTNWRNGEPNNCTYNCAETKLMIYTTNDERNGKWNDIRPNRRFPAIYSRDATLIEKIEVRGAGRGECNGFYCLDGEFRGHNRWKHKRHNVWIRRGQIRPRWYIANRPGAPGGAGDWYHVESNTPMPPEHGWDGGVSLRYLEAMLTEDVRRRLGRDRARVRETEARLEEASARHEADRKRLAENYRKRVEAERASLEAYRKQVQETEARLAALLATQAEHEVPVERPGFTRKLSTFLFGEQEPVAESEAEPQAEAWYGEQEPTVEGVYVEMESERYEMEPER